MPVARQNDDYAPAKPSDYDTQLRQSEDAAQNKLDSSYSDVTPARPVDDWTPSKTGEDYAPSRQEQADAITESKSQFTRGDESQVVWQPATRTEQEDSSSYSSNSQVESKATESSIVYDRQPDAGAGESRPVVDYTTEPSVVYDRQPDAGTADSKPVVDYTPDYKAAEPSVEYDRRPERDVTDTKPVDYTPEYKTAEPSVEYDRRPERDVTDTKPVDYTPEYKTADPSVEYDRRPERDVTDTKPADYTPEYKTADPSVEYDRRPERDVTDTKPADYTPEYKTADPSVEYDRRPERDGIDTKPADYTPEYKTAEPSVEYDRRPELDVTDTKRADYSPDYKTAEPSVEYDRRPELDVTDTKPADYSPDYRTAEPSVGYDRQPDYVTTESKQDDYNPDSKPIERGDYTPSDAQAPKPDYGFADIFGKTDEERRNENTDRAAEPDHRSWSEETAKPYDHEIEHAVTAQRTDDSESARRGDEWNTTEAARAPQRSEDDDYRDWISQTWPAADPGLREETSGTAMPTQPANDPNSAVANNDDDYQQWLSQTQNSNTGGAVANEPPAVVSRSDDEDYRDWVANVWPAAAGSGEDKPETRQASQSTDYEPAYRNDNEVERGHWTAEAAQAPATAEHEAANRGGSEVERRHWTAETAPVPTVAEYEPTNRSDSEVGHGHWSGGETAAAPSGAEHEPSQRGESEVAHGHWSGESASTPGYAEYEPTYRGDHEVEHNRENEAGHGHGFGEGTTAHLPPDSNESDEPARLTAHTGEFDGARGEHEGAIGHTRRESDDLTASGSWFEGYNSYESDRPEHKHGHGHEHGHGFDSATASSDSDQLAGTPGQSDAQVAAIPVGHSTDPGVPVGALDVAGSFDPNALHIPVDQQSQIDSATAAPVGADGTALPSDIVNSDFTNRQQDITTNVDDITTSVPVNATNDLTPATVDDANNVVVPSIGASDDTTSTQSTVDSATTVSPDDLASSYSMNFEPQQAIEPQVVENERPMPVEQSTPVDEPKAIEPAPVDPIGSTRVEEVDARLFDDPTSTPSIVAWDIEPTTPQAVAYDTIKGIEANIDTFTPQQHDIIPAGVGTPRMESDDYSAADDRERLRLQDEERRRREEEEERRRKEEEDIKRLSDSMLTAFATNPAQEDAERARADRLWEEQQRQEELNRQDNHQQKYVVKPNDTLESIAIKKFGSSELVELIYDINKAKITIKVVANKPRYVLKPGSVLILPSRRQVREWKQRRLSQAANSIPNSQRDFQRMPLVDEAAAARRSNVESYLGPLNRNQDKVNTNKQYLVRLGDSLRSVAMKHPAINDVRLWKLLAMKNGLPTTTDAKGAPKAVLTRGQTLILPTPEEIAAFNKQRITGEFEAIQSPITKGVTTTVDMVSKDCPSCHRLVVESCTFCPACGYLFNVEGSNVPQETRTVAVPHQTAQSVPVAASNHDRTVAVPQDRTVVADDRTAAIANDDGAAIVPQFVQQDEDEVTTLSFQRDNVTTLRFQDASGATTLLFAQKESRATVQFDNVDTLKFDDSKNLRFGRSRKEATRSMLSASSASEFETIHDRAVQQLSEVCRLIKSRVSRGGSNFSDRAQLEVRKEDRWVPILTYEVSEYGSLRHEVLPTGGTKSMQIDLPMQFAQDMVDNDLATNWMSYCRRFLAGKRLTA